MSSTLAVEEKEQTIRQGKIQSELASIQPILESAKSAVGSISAKDIQEIRALRAPPEVIRDILEGVMCLMGIQDTSWATMKTFLLKLKDDILNFDMDNVNRGNIQHENYECSFLVALSFLCGLFLVSCFT